jgi:DNA-binding CsgD family transcriptional regulator
MQDAHYHWLPTMERTADPALTARQRAVAALAATGLTNAEIAARLRSTAGTVAGDLVRIARRLGVRTRADVVAWAAERLP